MNHAKKAILGTVLAVTAAAGASPAIANDYHRTSDDTAAIAVGAGVIGLALGAIIASSDNDHRRDRYDDSTSYYAPEYSRGWSYRDSYYRDRDGHRHHRDEYARRHGDYDDRRGDDYRRDPDYRRGYASDRETARRGY